MVAAGEVVAAVASTRTRAGWEARRRIRRRFHAEPAEQLVQLRDANVRATCHDPVRLLLHDLAAAELWRRELCT